MPLHPCPKLVFRRRCHPQLMAIVLASAAMLTGCTSAPLTISPAPGRAPTDDPMLQTVEQAHRVQVRLLTSRYSHRLEELPAFDISATNRGSAALTFTGSDVAVFSGTRPVRIYTAGELVERIQNEAEQSAHERSGESAEKILQTPHTRRDPSSAIVMIERDKALDQTVASRARRSRTFAELVTSIVPVSIAPGGQGSGIIKLHAEDIRVGERLRIVVTLDGDRYEFTYDVVRGQP